MDRFNICQAYSQLESDYNKDGWLQERPSNQRRRESIGCQLMRLGYSNPYGGVDITGEENNDSEDEVREIYMRAVLRLGLPIDANLLAKMRKFFVPEFLAQFLQTQEVQP